MVTGLPYAEARSVERQQVLSKGRSAVFIPALGLRCGPDDSVINQERYIQRRTGREPGNVRLLVISPVDPVDGDEGPFPVTSVERNSLLPNTEVDEVLCKGAPAAIVGEGAVSKVVPLIADKARWAESSGYDAVVVNCMVDPGVREIQRELKIPVIGAGRAATGLAMAVGDRPTSVFPNNVRVNELASRQGQALEEMKSISRRRIETRGVDAVVLGCAYLGGAAGILQDDIGVPVMPTTEIALRTAETVVLLNIQPARPDVMASRASRLRQVIYRAKDKVFLLTVVLKRKLRAVLP